MSLIPPTVLCIVVAVLYLNVANSSSMEWFCVCSKSIVNTTCNAGLWNLDFFLFLYNLTCVSPIITATQSYFIEVAIGVYPLVLLVILYSFVTLHDYGCRIVVKIWKSFHFLIFRFHRKLHLKTSLIGTFATKIFRSLYVLTPVALYSPDGSYSLVLSCIPQ